ncbi:MAG: ribonuclease D [Gammaproteobacteria bacterium]|nr:ribonuclease D [Gammaproteobacteria bacterium]
MFNYIENQQQLDVCCQTLEQRDCIAIDTEFVRERTFYPQPGLIQVSDGDQISLIDPIACKDLQPLFNLLEAEQITIIMHSSSEDIELFYHMGCGIITRLFDTQIAAAWLGMGQSLSLQNLIISYENITIEKQLSRTNWLQRPLSDAQLQYAAKDVLYLTDIYQQQTTELSKAGFIEHLKQDCDLLCEKKSIQLNDDYAYLKVKKALLASGDALSRLKVLSRWREQQARKENKPRQHVIKDEQLLSISIEFPKTIEQLEVNCNLVPYHIRRYGNALLSIIKNLQKEKEITEPVINIRKLPNGGKTLNQFRGLLNELHEQTNIPREVLPSKRWLEQFLLHYVAHWYPQPDGWIGWRKQLLNQAFMQIINQNNFTKPAQDNKFL